jgi:hypothetical protein
MSWINRKRKMPTKATARIAPPRMSNILESFFSPSQPAERDAMPTDLKYSPPSIHFSYLIICITNKAALP